MRRLKHGFKASPCYGLQITMWPWLQHLIAVCFVSWSLKKGTISFPYPWFLSGSFIHTANRAGCGIFLMVGTALHAGKFWTWHKPFVTEPCRWGDTVLINMSEQHSNLKLHFNSVQVRWVKSWFDLYQWKSGIIPLSSRGSFSFTSRCQKLALIAFIFILELKLKHVCYF